MDKDFADFQNDFSMADFVNALAGEAEALKHFGVSHPASAFKFREPYLRLNERLFGKGWWNRLWWGWCVRVFFPGWYGRLLGDLDVFKKAFQAELLEKVIGRES